MLVRTTLPTLPRMVQPNAPPLPRPRGLARLVQRAMNPAELRRLYRAAHEVDTLLARAGALQDRYALAEALLRAALADGPLILPGYLAFLSDGRATVARSAITDAAQLALWRHAP